ncbi:MAG: acyltransferase [Akkermansiaceae bacterium]
MSSTHTEDSALRISPEVTLGRGVRLHGFANFYGCEIGEDTRIGCFVEIQQNSKIGARCKISSHTLICEGVTIEDEVFIGHGVMFTNDRRPRATNTTGNPCGPGDWQCLQTLVKRGASIGSGSTLLGGITIGENAMIGAGSVVTSDVLPGTTVAGNPARALAHTIPAAASHQATGIDA